MFRRKIMKKVNKITVIDNGDPRLVGHYVEGMGIVQMTKSGVKNEEETKGMTAAELIRWSIRKNEKKDAKR